MADRPTVIGVAVYVSLKADQLRVFDDFDAAPRLVGWCFAWRRPSRHYYSPEGNGWQQMYDGDQ